MSKTFHFLIVHGVGGSPERNWFPWLKSELENKGHTVHSPAFPTPEGQSFESWEKVALNAIQDLPADQIVLIGHSIGATFVLGMAEKASLPYKAIFSVSPFNRKLGFRDFDPVNQTIAERTYDWQRVKSGAQNIVCFAGDNDPYVPLNYSKEIAEFCGADFVVIENGGHLNAEFDFFQFPRILEEIEKRL